MSGFCRNLELLLFRILLFYRNTKLGGEIKPRRFSQAGTDRFENNYDVMDTDPVVTEEID